MMLRRSLEPCALRARVRHHDHHGTVFSPLQSNSVLQLIEYNIPVATTHHGHNALLPPAPSARILQGKAELPLHSVAAAHHRDSPARMQLIYPAAPVIPRAHCRHEQYEG